MNLYLRAFFFVKKFLILQEIEFLVEFYNNRDLCRTCVGLVSEFDFRCKGTMLYPYYKIGELKKRFLKKIVP